MEEVVEALDTKFARVLKAVAAEVAPGVEVDERALMRSFRTRLERGFDHWEYVPDRCVEAE
jgi:hypothetical protein